MNRANLCRAAIAIVGVAWCLAVVFTVEGCNLRREIGAYDPRARELVKIIEGVAEVYPEEWGIHARTARAMWSSGQLFVRDLPGDYLGIANYKIARYILLDESMVQKVNRAQGAGVLIHELTHVIHRTGSEAYCNRKQAQFVIDARRVTDGNVPGTGDRRRAGQRWRDVDSELPRLEPD